MEGGGWGRGGGWGGGGVVGGEGGGGAYGVVGASFFWWVLSESVSTAWGVRSGPTGERTTDEIYTPRQTGKQTEHTQTDRQNTPIQTDRQTDRQAGGIFCHLCGPFFPTEIGGKVPTGHETDAIN